MRRAARGRGSAVDDQLSSGRDWSKSNPGSLSQGRGASGETPKLGTKAAVDALTTVLAWDVKSQTGILPDAGGEVIVHEFDFKKEDQVVYDENGVTIKSWPAIHSLDGSVSYRLEWNGLVFVFGGDTRPNKWFIEYAKNADLVIHESFLPPELFVELYNQPPGLAWRACCAFHTSGQAFGKVMSTVKPRQAVAFHFFNEEATRYRLYDNIRETYDGSLSMATDMMVWNITKDEIVERMAVATEEAWAVRGGARQPPPEKGRPSEMTPFIIQGRWDEGAQPVQKKMLDEFMEKYKLQDQDWRKQMMKKR